MGVDLEAVHVAVTGDVQLHHPRGRDCRQVPLWIEAVVAGGHINVVHVEQQQAIGFLGQGDQELPLGEAVAGGGQVRRRVLQNQLAPQPILHLPHAAGDVGEALLRVRQRQQVVQVDAIDTGPAQVIRHPGRLDAVDQRRQAVQIIGTQRIDTADRQRHTVQHQRKVAPHLLQHGQRLAAGDHEVLGNRLEPVDAGRRCRQQVGKMFLAQAKAEAQRR